MRRLKWPLLLASSLFIACGQPTSESKREESRSDSVMVVNGVERTELALLMRKMYDEMALVKDSIKLGYTVKTNFLEEYKRIQTAHATEPEKIDATYKAMAEAFLINYEMFETSQDEQAKAFNGMLQNCLVCHENKCPGPVKAIKKLRIKP
ncbi:MAG: hypothetical protein HQ500_13350 [Flavobacteriales bacterium]|nr:hypothetical protein [Flavobacteriales bacterium]